MSNTRLYLAIGIPSVLVLLSWLSTFAQKLRLGDRLDRMTEDFHNQVTTLRSTIHGIGSSRDNG